MSVIGKLARANAVRIPLASKSVQVICTSPPFFGLRRYKIQAEWVGGLAECKHVPPEWTDDPGDHGAAVDTVCNANLAKWLKRINNTCPYCGAIYTSHEIGDEELHDCMAWTRHEPPCGSCYVCMIREVAAECWRVLRDDGVLWCNLGDSYFGGGGYSPNSPSNVNGSKQSTQRSAKRGGVVVPFGMKQKDMCAIPWRVALALQSDGWFLRSAPPWVKKNSLPESVEDRSGTSHEYVFMLTKKARYYYDVYAVKKGSTGCVGMAASFRRTTKDAVIPNQSVAQHRLERDDTEDTGTRNRRTGDWWFESLDIMIDEQRAYLAHLESIRDNGGMLVGDDGLPLGFAVNPKGYKGAHYATWPERLVEPMILASTPAHGCCPECHAPWVRVTEVTRDKRCSGGHSPKRASINEGGVESSGLVNNALPTITTIGWEPTCNCGRTDTVPSIVLDVFCGSGTTVAVAESLGRRGFGIDLSQEYLVEDATKRVMDTLRTGHQLTLDELA